jgi:hypothetical protein
VPPVVNASDIASTAFGTIASTNVQDALEEIANEAGSGGTATTNASELTSGILPDARLSSAVTTSLGLADTAIQSIPLIDDDTFATATASNIPSSESVKAYVDANAGSGGASAAIDLTVTPTGNLTATNGQAAFNELQTAIDGLSGNVPSAITTITQYNNVSDLPAVVGDEVDTYAMVISNNADWDLNGMYAIIGGVWKHIYHYNDYYRMPIKYIFRNEINLDSPNIVDGFTFSTHASGTAELVANASKYVTNFIPVRPGEWLKKTADDRYAFYDVNKNIIPYSNAAYGGNNLSDDIKISVNAIDVKYVRWSSNISAKNNSDGVLRQMYAQSNADVVGWWDYHFYERDNDRFTYENEGIIWKNYQSNLFRPQFADYTRQVQSTGNVWTGGAMSEFMSCQPIEIFSSNVPSQQIGFYDADFVRIGGTVGGTGFTTPTGCYYYTVGFTTLIDFFNIVITKARKTYEDVTRVSTDILRETTPNKVKVCLIGDSMSSETEAFATETAFGTITTRLLKMYGAHNISLSGESYRTFRNDVNSGVSTTPFADVYVLFLGTNDYGFANQSISDLNTSISTLVNTNLKGINPNAKFYFITPPVRQNDHVANINGLTLKQTADAIIKFAQTEGWDYLDFFRESGLNPDFASFRTDWFISADGLHPNNQAQKMYLYPEIAKFFKYIIQNEK